MKESNSKPGLMACRMLVVLSGMLLCSCGNDDILDNNQPYRAGDLICFGVSSGENARARVIAGDDGTGHAVGHFVLRAEDSADTLCVSSVVSDGICSAPFGSGRPITRGMPVSSSQFYSSFHVLAYLTTEGALREQFYMDEDVFDNGANRWSSRNVHYWPGEGHTLNFYAWAPIDAGLTTPSTSASTTLGYTVPANAVEQKDVVVAVTDESPGNYNAVQSLTFRHICTAVRFEVGSEMQPGVIESVTLKGVRSSGIYDMSTSVWTLDESLSGDFSQTLGKETSGTEQDGTEITPLEGTFMMLPQTLPPDAEIQVVFSGRDKPLTASIANSEWKMGTTVTYKLSISPEYELEFISRPEMQDAHYVIYPIEIKAGEIPGGWTMTSTDSKVTLRTSLTDLEKQGYWIEDDRGSQTISSTAVGDNLTVYAFLEENVTDAIREVTLELRPTNQPDAKPQTFTISQLCPSWNGGLGCERIEDGDYPWGFKWPAGYKVTYNMGRGLDTFILGLLIRIFGTGGYVSISGGGVFRDVIVTIDYSKVNASDVALSADNGQQNTVDLYNYQGISDASDLEARLEAMGGTKTVEPAGASILNPSEFAARACAMKNKYSKTVESSVEKPVLISMDWYLPSQNEAIYVRDVEYPLNGDYWTSTAINDNATAYKMNGSSEDRATNLHVRAVRRRP